MARTTVPDGAWAKTNSKVHWLNYALIAVENDFTGNEHVQLNKAIREKVNEAVEILSEHNIKIYNIYTMKDCNPGNWDVMHRIAIGFQEKEDLMLAKMILKCNV